MYALLCPANNTATTRVGKQMLYNWFNPFDETKFDWKHLSKAGKQAFSELQSYCDNVVHWKKLETPYGKGEWLGLYQYRTDYEQVNRTYKKKFGVDYPNKDLYGIAYPDSFTNAIEELRIHVEALAIELCLSPNKGNERTRDTFLEDTSRKIF
ncbi:hypothetical protein FACS1894214_5250 [Planctomycetales bacterium]|nr:hypothetical protein FACS1894214_5250 [Planctomycetales bacterium]